MNSSVTKIPCTLQSFFYYWLQFTAPLHKLQKKEMKILATILHKRYELTKVITDDGLVDSFLFSKETRDQMLEESGESRNNFQVVLSNFRKQGIVLPGNKLNKKFIPNITRNSNRFDFMIIFDIEQDAK